MNFVTFVYLVLQCTLICRVNTLNILGIFPHQGKSHFFVFEVYLRELAARGHNVTVISHFPLKNAPDNYRDISIAGTVTAVEGLMPIESSYWGILRLVLFMMETGNINCEAMLTNKQFQNLLSQNPKFDVVVVEQFNSDCALGVAYHLKAPVVGLTSHVLLPWHYSRFGITYNPSYMPNHFFGGGTKPAFYQRLEREIFHWCFNQIYSIHQKRDQTILDKHLRYVPPLEDLASEIKVMLLYHHFVLTQTKTLTTNLIEVGGYHVSPAKQITQDLKKFIEEAEHGVIHISFGTVVNISTIATEKLNAISEAIMEFPQRFIWKLKSEQKKAFDNIRDDKLFITEWLPQVDILAHPKTLAFFSHSGMLSTTEAIHYGVPMVAMPILGDQPGNAAAIEESGLGVQIQIDKLTKKNLVKIFNQVLDTRFRENVKELSMAWHDRPLTPLDTAIYWTEFAARRSNFSIKHAAADVPFYQIVCLDILSVFIIFLLVLFFIFRFAVLLRIKTTVDNQTKKSKRE